MKGFCTMAPWHATVGYGGRYFAEFGVYTGREVIGLGPGT